MSLLVDRLLLGSFQTNCYILRSGPSCVIVDPAAPAEALIQMLDSQGAQPDKIWLTHGHGDHISGIAALKECFPDVIVCCPVGDAHMLSDPRANLSSMFGLEVRAPRAEQLLEPGTAVMVGPTSWQVLDTSGHSPGGVSFYCQAENLVITGDALFAGSIGRTDIPGADTARLLRNIQEQLLVLPDETRVLPGHGPDTTMGREKRANPFLAHDWPGRETGGV